MNNVTRRHGAEAKVRRGVALVIVIVLFAISLTLFGVWAKTIVGEQRRLTNQQMRWQAVRLAEAGLGRARARIAADAAYEGETWHVPGEALGGTHAGAVRITISRDENSQTQTCEATAEYPAGTLRRAQVSKQIELLHPPSGNES
jgi:Tfp pilus assembly protein PilX